MIQFQNQLYNITMIANIPSIIQHGILSHYLVRGIEHESIALEDIQERRENKSVPNGLKLHGYANLYFNPRNAMMYLRRSLAADLCVLVVSDAVLEIEGTVVSDMNAAKDFVRFWEAQAGLGQLNFDDIYTRNWNVDDEHEKARLKGCVCAEVLVPDKVDFAHVKEAYAVDEEAKNKLEKVGFPLPIAIKPDIFFRGE
jgi:hypothetical protein